MTNFNTKLGRKYSKKGVSEIMSSKRRKRKEEKYERKRKNQPRSSIKTDHLSPPPPPPIFLSSPPSPSNIPTHIRPRPCLGTEDNTLDLLLSHNFILYHLWPRQRRLQRRGHRADPGASIAGLQAPFRHGAVRARIGFPIATSFRAVFSEGGKRG